MEFINLIKSAIKKRLDTQTRVLVKNSTWVLIATLFQEILVFLRSIIIARGLGIEIYGIYVIIVAFSENVQEIFNLNLGTPLTKFGAKFKIENRTDKLAVMIKGFAWTALLSGISSVLCIWLILDLFYDTVFKSPGLFWYVVLFGVAQITTFYDFMSTSLLRLYYKFRLNSIVTMAMSIVEFVAITVAILFNPRNLTAFFIAVITARFLNAFIINSVALWELRKEILPYWQVKLSELKGEWKGIRKFTINNSISRTLFTLINRGDVLLLGILAGPIQVAYYNIGKRIAKSISILITPLATSIYPQLSLLIAERKIKDIKTMLRRITMLALYPSITFLIVMLLMNKKLILVFYGRDFVGATQSFSILLIAAVFNAIFFWALNLIFSLGMVVLRLIVTMIALAVGILIAFFLSAQGATGMATASLAANLVILSCFLYFSIKQLNEI